MPLPPLPAITLPAMRAWPEISTEIPCPLLSFIRERITWIRYDDSSNHRPLAWLCEKRLLVTRTSVVRPILAPPAAGDWLKSSVSLLIADTWLDPAGRSRGWP